MIVKSFVNNPFQENTYILSDPDTQKCVLIDPGMQSEWEWKQVLEYIENEHLVPVEVWLTHCHVDHMMGTGYVAEKYGVTIAGPMEDYEKLPAAQLQGQLFGVPVYKEIAPVVRNIKEGDNLQLGNFSIQVYDVPGHSFHGLCYYLPTEKILFTGDVLFFCSVGRSDFGAQMGGDGELLIEGIRSKLMSLPPETVIYPGHGPQTSIQNEITHNPYI